MGNAEAAMIDRPESNAVRRVWLWIDPTRRCNLACSLCYTKESHSKDDLHPESLAMMLDNIERSSSIVVQQLTFNWRGEPLMNLLGLLRDRQPRYSVDFHTNGTLITERLAASIMENIGPWSICVS